MAGYLRFVAVLGFAMLTGCKGPTFEELDAKARAEEAAAKERARKIVDERAARDAQKAQIEKLKSDGEQRQAEADREKQAAERAADRVALRSKAFMATPVERQKLLREQCESVIGCDAETARAIFDAADGAERRALEALANRIEADRATKVAKVRTEAREQFAVGLERAMLEKRLNPDDVSAVGPEKTTLRIKAWFCSNQYVYEFQRKGGDGELAKAIGFRRMTCENALETWTAEL